MFFCNFAFAFYSFSLLFLFWKLNYKREIVCQGVLLLGFIKN